MLTNITPGFYKMRNGRLALVVRLHECFLKVHEAVAEGYSQDKYGSSVMTWNSKTGLHLREKESDCDLVEKIPC